MSKKNQGKRSAVRQDDGYPFDTGDWAKWSNRKRLDWMINFRDRLANQKANTYYKRHGMTDKDMERIIADTEEMEKVVLGEEYNAAQTAARNAKPPRRSAEMLGQLIDDLSANDYYKARRIGLTDEQIDKMRADTDKYLAEIEAWERRQKANEILGIARPAKPPTDLSGDALIAKPGTTFDDIDDTALKAAFAAGDEEAVDREWNIWIEKLEAKAARDPIFAKWFEDFRADQEKLLRWDETIGEDED
ncbi:MAG: hypothetical protein ABL999_13440 [Pyrinomonadaceae bacterium]